MKHLTPRGPGDHTSSGPIEVTKEKEVRELIEYISDTDCASETKYYFDIIEPHKGVVAKGYVNATEGFMQHLEKKAQKKGLWLEVTSFEDPETIDQIH